MGWDLGLSRTSNVLKFPTTATKGDITLEIRERSLPPFLQKMGGKINPARLNPPPTHNRRVAPPDGLYAGPSSRDVLALSGAAMHCREAFGKSHGVLANKMGIMTQSGSPCALNSVDKQSGVKPRYHSIITGLQFKNFSKKILLICSLAVFLIKIILS